MDIHWKANSQWYQNSAQIMLAGAAVVPFACEKVKLHKTKELFQVGFEDNTPYLYLSSADGKQRLCVHVGIFDNVGLDVVKKESHPHIIVLSSKKDATIPEISFGFSVLEDRTAVEKKLKSMVEIQPKDLPITGHRFCAPVKKAVDKKCAFCQEKIKRMSSTCSVCDCAVHGETCLTLLNYFDCCAHQLTKQTTSPSKENLQNLFQSFQKTLLPVIDVSGIKLFEYIVKQAHTHFPVVKTDKAKEEPKSDIYNFECFNGKYLADNRHLFIIGESSVFDYLMDKILHLEEDAEIAVATQILEKLAQQDNVKERVTNGYLLPLLEIVTRDILRVMNVIGVVNDKIMANGFVCEATFLEGVDFSVSVAEKVIRLVVDSLTNYVFTVTNEINQKILSSLIAICNTASEQIDVNTYRARAFKQKNFIIMSQWKSIVNRTGPILYKAYTYADKWNKMIGGSVGLMGIVRAASEGTFRIHNVIKLDDIVEGDQFVSKMCIYEGFAGLTVGRCHLRQPDGSEPPEIIYKSFYVANKSVGPEQKFWKEIALQTIASHPCLARFLGCCIHDVNEKIQRSTLFLKYYRRGNLWSIISESEEQLKKRHEIEKNPKLFAKKDIEKYKAVPLMNYMDMRLFCNIAMDVCNGIDFLHDKNIMHRDLKPGNILIDDYYNAVVCDFGDSRVSTAGEKINMTKTGTGNWMSPEMLANLEKKDNEQLPSLTLALDIYSLGVIFWQMLHKVQVPYDKVEDPRTCGISQDMVYIVNVLQYREPFLPEFEENYPEIVAMIEMMWEGEVSKRPKIKKVLTMLYDFEDPAFSELSERKNRKIRLCGKYEIIGDNNEWCINGKMIKNEKNANEWKLINKYLDDKSKIALALALTTDKNYWNRDFFVKILKKNASKVRKNKVPPPKYFEIVVGNTCEKFMCGDIPHHDTTLTKWSFFIKSLEATRTLADSTGSPDSKKGSDGVKKKPSSSNFTESDKSRSVNKKTKPESDSITSTKKHSSSHIKMTESDKSSSHSLNTSEGPKRPTKGPSDPHSPRKEASTTHSNFKLDSADSIQELVKKIVITLADSFKQKVYTFIPDIKEGPLDYSIHCVSYSVPAIKVEFFYEKGSMKLDYHLETANEEGTVLPLIISQAEITVNQVIKKEYTGGSLPKALGGSKQTL